MAGLAKLAGLGQPARHGTAEIVPLRQSEIDYRPIFAQAEKAGLQQFYIEQDTAPASGNSIAVAQDNYRYLFDLLT